MKNPVKKLLNYYTYHMKLQSKFIISHLILILIPTMVIAIFFYEKLYDIIVENTIQSEQAISEQTANTLEATLAQISYTSRSILDSALITNLFCVSEENASAFTVSTTQIESSYQSILGMIDHELISDIRIYYDTPYEALALFNNEKTPIFQPASKMYSTLWYGTLSLMEEPDLFCPSIYLSPSEINNNGDLAYIYKIPYADNEEHIAAYVVVYFSQDRIDSILRKDITVTNSATYIVNEHDHPVSTSDANLSGAYFKNLNTLQDIIGAPGKFETYTFIDDNIYIGYRPIANTDWYMVSVLPKSSLMQKGNKLVFQFLGLYLLFLVLAFIMAVWLSNSIVKRISSVIRQMKKVRSGKPVRLEQKGLQRDEIGDLIDTYNYLTDEISHLLEKQEQAAKDLRLSEFRALQAQINPHFLYNTLDMMNWLSLSDQKEELSKAIHTLSRFYKLTLSKHDEAIPLRQELEHVSLYVQIQNMRYDDSIHLIVDIPMEIDECRIPKLTLQPIVENAIQHGIFMKENKSGNIVITGWRENGDVIIVISDDGVGIDEALTKKILQGEGNNGTGSNIGIYNTHLRLQLLYGTKYGLRYRSELGKGTEVEVCIPI